jgi:hypothetical protein
LATQRLARLSKSVAAECQNVLVGRTTQIDQDRAADVLNLSRGKVREEFGREIGRMPTGDFYAYGMAFHQELPVRFTVTKPDTMPKAGTKRVIVPPPPHAIQALLPKLADLPAEADAKAKTEADLREEIRQLKKQFKAVPYVQTISPERERMLLEQINTLSRTAGAYEKAMDGIYAQAGKMQDAALAIKSIVETTRQNATTAPQATALKQAANPLPTASVRPVPQTAPRMLVDSRDAGLTGPEQRILNAIAWFHALGIENPEKPAVAFMAGYTFGSGGFNNPCGSLNGKGLIRYLSDNRMQLTPEGLNASAPVNVPATNAALHDAVLGKLGGPEQRILNPLLKKYPNGMDNQALAEASGYAPGSGGYNNPRGRLKSLGLIRYESGIVYANSLLFPEG